MTAKAAIKNSVGRRGSAPAAVAAAIGDGLAIALSSGVAYVLVATASLVLGTHYADPGKVFAERSLAFPLIASAVMAWFFLSAHYHVRSPFWDEARKVVSACAFGLMAEGFLLFAGKADGSRLATFLTWMVAPFAIMAFRVLVKFLFRRLGVGEANAVIFGRSREASAAARTLSCDRYLGYRVCGIFDMDTPAGAVAVALELGADTAVVALSGDDAGENLIASKLRDAGFHVILVPPVLGFAASGIRMQYVIGQDSILLVDKIDVVPGLSRLAKRFFDLSVTSAALMVAAVPMILVAAVVRLDGGPAMFSHERVGVDGRKFSCLKFRSMAVGSAERLARHIEQNPDARREWEETRKLKNDPRVTRFGKFIRKTALDELPQLFNVLRGDMSLVGPRPVTEPELDYYGKSVSLYLSVRPGVTGLWQVSGRNDLTYEERVGLDTWYVRNWSPWHDTAIILKTIPALLLRRGAY